MNFKYIGIPAAETVFSLQHPRLQCGVFVQSIFPLLPESVAQDVLGYVTNKSLFPATGSQVLAGPQNKKFLMINTGFVGGQSNFFQPYQETVGALSQYPREVGFVFEKMVQGGSLLYESATGSPVDLSVSGLFTFRIQMDEVVASRSLEPTPWHSDPGVLTLTLPLTRGLEVSRHGLEYAVFSENIDPKMSGKPPVCLNQVALPYRFNQLLGFFSQINGEVVAMHKGQDCVGVTTGYGRVLAIVFIRLKSRGPLFKAAL